MRKTQLECGVVADETELVEKLETLQKKGEERLKAEEIDDKVKAA